MSNTALVFIKPHANTPGTERVLLTTLEQNRINIVSQGLMISEDVDRKGTIDRHYFSIARYATMWRPAQMPLAAESEQRFEAAFGDSWKKVLADTAAADASAAASAAAGGATGAAAAAAGGTATKKPAAAAPATASTATATATTPGAGPPRRPAPTRIVINATEAVARFGGEDALAAIWGAAQMAKLAPGLYAAFSEAENVYIINGFYMAMRRKFTEPGKSVRWFVVQWNEADLPWADFRCSVIGATNPEKAALESVRSKILYQWQALGLPGKPNGSDNGVHASASPIEGLNERIIWLNSTVAHDRYGRTLLDAGVDAGLITSLLANPTIHVQGGAAVPVFDVLEDKDSSYVTAFLVNYQLAHGAGGESSADRANSKRGDSSSSSSGRNHALIFIKPTANTSDVQLFVEAKLRNAGIQIRSKADVSGKVIAESRIVDSQFASLCKYATKATASEYHFDTHQKCLFRSTFARDFDEAVGLGLVCNARDASERMNFASPDAMLGKWVCAVKQTFAPGLHLAYYADEDLYVANGFYAAMAAAYNKPTASVRLLHVEWDEALLSWLEFLEIVVGASDPIRARPGSIRAQIHAQWRSLGLATPPDALDNGVNASASPIEALRDRMTWFGGSVAGDVFGRAALGCGVPEQALLAWLANPEVTLQGRRGEVYSIVRGLDSSKVIRLLAGQKVSSVVSASERAHLERDPHPVPILSGKAQSRSSADLLSGAAPALPEEQPSSARRGVASSIARAGTGGSPAAAALLTPRRRLHARARGASPRGVDRDGVDVAPPKPGSALTPSPRQLAMMQVVHAGNAARIERGAARQQLRQHDLSSGDLDEAKLRQYFAIFDANNSGTIDRGEFKGEFRQFEHFGLTPSPQEVDELFDRYDFRGDGRLTFDEFALLMCHRTQM